MKLRSIILGVLLIQCAVFAQFFSDCPPFSDSNDYINDPYELENGLFECGDPNLTEYEFIPPIYWERIPHPDNINQDDCYTGLHEEFTCLTRDGEWHIPHPYNGNFFVVLSTGGDGGTLLDKEVKGSSIAQNVFLSLGDAIIGAYFFGTKDYLPYNCTV
jgi:hypothetical protein